MATLPKRLNYNTLGGTNEAFGRPLTGLPTSQRDGVADETRANGAGPWSLVLRPIVQIQQENQGALTSAALCAFYAVSTLKKK